MGNPGGTSRTGSFEITTEKGTVAWSKLNGMGFPDEKQVGDIIQKLQADGCK